jgi:hypothetical protein
MRTSAGLRRLSIIATRTIALLLIAACAPLGHPHESKADALNVRPGSFQSVWSQDFECGDYDGCKQSGDGWKYELIQPDRQSALLAVESGNAHSGQLALHAKVPDRDSGDKSSKSMIAIKQSRDGRAFEFARGSSIRVTAWYWLAPRESNAYLLDVENSGSGNHGIRFYVAPDGTPAFNRDKLGIKPNVISNPSGVRTPTNEWFKFTVELTFSNNDDGHTRILIDDRVAIDFTGKNMGSFKFYDSIQLGYTVSQKRGELWMDDADISYAPGTSD